MPSTRVPTGATTAASVPLAVRLLRLAADVIVLAVAAVCVLLLLVRFVAFPRIEAHRDDIAAELGRRIGQPVSIGAIVTGWDGWNPRLSIRGFTVSDRADPAAKVLELPRVDLVVSWTSLPLFDLSLRELALESPRIAVRRDPQGLIHVAGLAIDPAVPRDDTAVSAWLLRQRRIVVHDALVTWTDELRHTPQLVLDRVELRIEQGFGEHRFGLTGVPPPELAAPIDLRGEFQAVSLREWQRARGRTYLRLDYADLAAWREWLPLPVSIDSGKGAVRLWFDFAEGAPRTITADVELADVRARLAPDLPPVDLLHVAGRIAGGQSDGRRELTTRALTFAARDGTALAPTDLSWRHDAARDGRAAQGQIAFDRLELAPISALAAQLPLPESLRTSLARFAPRGTLRNAKGTWEGPAGAPEKYTLSATLTDVAFNGSESIPGVAGLTGRLDASDARGTLTLDHHPLTIALPGVLAAPVALDTAAARIGWTLGASTIVQVDDAAFSNVDFAGTASGSWRAEASGPGSVDLRAQVTRASVGPLSRYLPRQLAPPVRDWLLRALVKGTTSDARLVVKGNLAEFPFPQNRNGQFLVTMKARDGTLDYADGWPQISAIEADLRFEGTRLAIDAARGTVLGATIGRTHVEIPDLREHPARLHIAGEAEAPTGEFLSFIAQSPVAAWTGHAVDGVQAAGRGRLALSIDLALAPNPMPQIAGEFQFVDNQVQWPGLPPLAKVNGKLALTGKDVQARDITAELFAGPMRLTAQSGDGRVRVAASGTANIASVRQAFDLPLIDRVSGSTDWQLSVDGRGESIGWVVESSLKGATVDLPAPLGKAADEPMPLRIGRRELRGGREDALTFDYGRLARVLVHRQLAGVPAVDRALVLVGKAVDRAAEADRTGLWIRADMPTLNVDDWLAFQRSAEARSTTATASAEARPPTATGATAAAGASTALAIQGVDLEAGVLQALGRRFDAMKVTGRRSGNDWRLTLDGRDVAGTATWQGATPAQPNGRVVARLARSRPPGPGELVPWSGAVEPERAAGAANPWPAIDMSSEAFYNHDRNVGRLEVLAHPSGADWQIEKLALVNDAGRIDAAGVWRGGRAPQTRLDVKLDVKEAGAFLARFAMPDAIRNAPTTIEGQLAWAGAPSDFDYPSLSGSFRVQSGAGQFLKADPGVGRLLGVLSLQALPRRISLDFRDVFSEGFAFDSVVGTVRIQNGVMHTAAFRLAGPAATVDIAGDVDLAHETQQLRVRVQPSLSSSVSAASAALFIANPLVGAAVGAGTLLAQKFLNQPIEQLFAYEYGVSGGWDDPVVQRLSARTAANIPEAKAK
jgi:uncharacterized protein (TIGR02099 family)